MYIVNVPMLIRMAFSPGARGVLEDAIACFKADPGFSLLKFARALLNAAKGEKIVRHEGRFVLNSFLPPFPSPAYSSLMRAARDPERPYASQALARRSAPLSVFLAVTSACDCSCPHCSANSGDGTGDIDTAEWESIIREFSAMGTAIIGFTGGEPLMRADLESLVAAASGLSETIVYTNGRLLGPERARSLKAAGLFACGVSLDYPDAGRHDANRGKRGSFDAALAAVGNARSAGLYAFTQTMARRDLLADGGLEGIFRVASSAGAQEIRILEPIPAGRMGGSPGELFTETERDGLKRFQYAKNRKPGLPRVSTFAHTESRSQFGCGAGNQHSYVDSRGELFPCDFLPLSFGNVRSEGVRAAWLRMTEAMGIPKGGCFAITLKDVLGRRAGELPLSRRESERLCASYRSAGYPRFYELLQGKGGPASLDSGPPARPS